MPTPSIAIYPKALTLRDRTDVTVQPMSPADAQALMAFFLHLPEEDRFYLKDDVVAPGVVAGVVGGWDQAREPATQEAA
ncbi:MAG: hypothetical protein HYZ81_09150 [Nitrospinae bacterium]|nr:hypothetical protein [Nitrospinota bacterium]